MTYGSQGVTSGDDGFAITKSDSTVFTTMPRALYVGGGGDVALRTAMGTDLTFVGVPAGGYILMRCDKVLSTGTSATNIIGIL